MEVELKPVSVENWKACLDLALHPEQRDFVPSNLYSIAEAQFYPDARSLAIYSKENELVGYALYGKDSKTQKWKLFRLMIDFNHQGRGYGEAAMRLIIERISECSDATDISLVYRDDNYAARKLYKKLGFVDQGVNEFGKRVAKLSL